MKTILTVIAMTFCVCAFLSPNANAQQASGKAYKIGTPDWTIKSVSSLDSFRYAKANGLDGIQYSFGDEGVGLDLRTRENRDKVRAIVNETDVAICSLGLGRLNKVPLATTEEADGLVADCLQAMIKLKEEAAELEDKELAAKVSPKIVLLAFFGKGDINGDDERINTVIEKLKRFAPIAEKHGFTMGIESLLSEADHRRIMEGVGSPAVKVYYDTANSLRMGYDIYSEMKSLGTENICEVHLKQDKNLLGKGDVDFQKVKTLLRDMNYQGWLVIEGSNPKGSNPKESTKINTAFTRALFNGTQPSTTAQADGQTDDQQSFAGFWSLKMESGLPVWMKVIEKGAESEEDQVHLRLYIGPTGPHAATRENGRLKFEFKKKGRGKKAKMVVRNFDVGLKDGKLDGTMTSELKDGSTSVEKFTGVKVTPMPKQAPDLSKVRFGDQVTLFNGKDLTGWRPHESDKKMGWGVKDGLLVNTTPKTDFSATGAYANLRTVDEFEDFRLHIEFRIGKARNSGIYLRGMYEAQVVDRDSRMQGIQGVGAIFGTIPPSKNAGKVGGEWQTYDLTLVDRHATVVLNGEKVIDNQPVPAPTSGAIYTNPDAPGPIYLQGDHTSVEYRNIHLTPVIKE